MPNIGNGRRTAALCLLIVGSLLLIAVEQLLGAVADTHTEAVIDTHDLQPLPASSTPVAAAPMDSAAVTGEFEEPVKPTQAPTGAASTPDPTVATGPALFQTGLASTYG